MTHYGQFIMSSSYPNIIHIVHVYFEKCALENNISHACRAHVNGCTVLVQFMRRYFYAKRLNISVFKVLPNVTLFTL